MREIKFRAWNSHKKEMSEPFDLYQYMIMNESEQSRMTSGTTLPLLSQLTGLKDCFGAKLYEGDVVDEYGVNREIVFQDGRFCTLNERGDETLHSSSWVLVGNIYENPELIGK